MYALTGRALAAWQRVKQTSLLLQAESLSDAERARLHREQRLAMQRFRSAYAEEQVRLLARQRTFHAATVA